MSLNLRLTQTPSDSKRENDAGELAVGPAKPRQNWPFFAPTSLPALHWRGVLPARVSARALGPEPLAQAPGRQAGTSPGRELAGGARERGAADEGSGAGHGRYHH